MRHGVLALAALCLMSAQALAVEAGQLGLELNALQQTDTGCRITFLAENRLGTEVVRSSFELALFGASGGIDRLVALEFTALPEGKSRVVQFELKDLQCDSLGRVLVNDIITCDGGTLTPATCLAALAPTSRVTAAFGL